MKETMICGSIGTSCGVVALSIQSVQAWVSIIFTVLSFIFGIALPIIKGITEKIKAAKEDGVITKEEVKEIIGEVAKGTKEIVTKAKDTVKEIKEKKEVK